MINKLPLYALLVFGVVLASPEPRSLRAEPCARCGCECGCHAVCRPRCVTRSETDTEFSCECEDFCVPGEVRHEGCSGGCEGSGAPCECGTCWAAPFGVRIYTRKKLMTRDMTHEVPTTEWEVEYLCPRCACEGCTGAGCDFSCPTELPAEPAHARPPAPVVIDGERSAAAGGPPSIPHPQPRATLLEKLLDLSR